MDPELGVDEMRLLDRNKQTIWYSLPVRKVELTDLNGFRTGQYKVEYSEPSKIKLNIRWDDGLVRLEGFGLNGSGRRRMVVESRLCPITLGAILWIDCEPQYSEDSAVVGTAIVGKAKVGTRSARTYKPNYYVCEMPQRSLTQTVYIVEEVQVGQA